jgi:hypothetical protein
MKKEEPTETTYIKYEQDASEPALRPAASNSHDTQSRP